MEEIASNWLEWIRPYVHDYGCWLVFAIEFLKSLPFLGTVMPAAGILLVAGGLARQGQASVLLLGIAGFAGTFAGNIISYYIGLKAGHRLLQSPRWGKLIRSIGERVRKEPLLLLFCHFETFLRMFAPAAAGMSGMPLRRFLLLDFIGAAGWIACYLAAGYFLSRDAAQLLSSRLAFVVVGALILVLAFHYFRRRRQHAAEAQSETPDR